MDLKLFNYKLSIKNTHTESVVSGNSKALITGSNMFGNLNLLTNYKFADIVLYQIIEKILNAMSGIVWTFEGVENLILRTKLKTLFEKKFPEIYKKMYFNGFAVFAVNYKANDVMLLNDGFTVNADGVIKLDAQYNDYRCFVLFSKKYSVFGKTDFEICKDMYLHVDNLMNAINATTENLGAMGILTPEAISGVMAKFGDKEKERVQKEWSEKYGLKVGKWSILITPIPTKFQQINLPIKDLELQAKLENAVKLLAGYHQVPYELLAMSGQSTYANREEARKELIDITCKALANQLFDLSSDIFLGRNVKINYTFETIVK